MPPFVVQPPLRQRAARRRGALIVEMILVLVVLLIAAVGLVQFGVFFANAQQVAFAARVGGLEAAQTPTLPETNGAPVPGDIITAIEHQLESSGIEWCEIRLEHNVDTGGIPNETFVLESSVGGPCQCEEHNPLAVPPYPGTHYVRLTVCVPMSEVFPSQLSLFGDQIYGPEKTYQHTAIYRYEPTVS